MTPLATTCIEEYQKGNVHLTPVYPGVLIRVLPKPEMFGMLILPDAGKNKWMYEAIVLETYAPKKIKVSNRGTSQAKRDELLQLIKDLGVIGRTAQYIKLCEEIKQGFEHTSYIEMECALKPGDHIGFPYFSGLPIPGLNEEEYRVIPERNLFNKMDNTDPTARLVIDYEKEATVSQLEVLANSAIRNEALRPEAKEIAEDIIRHYHVIPRTLKSKMGYTDPNRPD